MTTIRAFFPKLGHFFPIFEKGQGRSPTLPSSSYAPDLEKLILHRKLLHKIVFNISQEPQQFDLSQHYQSFLFECILSINLTSSSCQRLILIPVELLMMLVQTFQDTPHCFLTNHQTGNIAAFAFAIKVTYPCLF